MSERDCGIWNGVKFLVDDNGNRIEGTVGECFVLIEQLQSRGAAGLSVKVLPSVTYMAGGISFDVNDPPNNHEVKVIRHD